MACMCYGIARVCAMPCYVVSPRWYGVVVGCTVEQGGEVVSGGQAMTLGAAEEYLGDLAWCATEGAGHEQVRRRRLDSAPCHAEPSKRVALREWRDELLTHTSDTRHDKVRAKAANSTRLLQLY